MCHSAPYSITELFWEWMVTTAVLFHMHGEKSNLDIFFFVCFMEARKSSKRESHFECILFNSHTHTHTHTHTQKHCNCNPFYFCNVSYFWLIYSTTSFYPLTWIGSWKVGVAWMCTAGVFYMTGDCRVWQISAQWHQLNRQVLEEAKRDL